MKQVTIKKWNLICLVVAIIILVLLCIAARSNHRSTDITGQLTTDSYPVTPQSYGAMADGVHDDTEAIQECIAENPNAIIQFPKGTYLISETIYLFGNSGGQHIDFGGSYFEWIGEDDPGTVMFEIANPESGRLDTTGAKESRALLTGGTFYGADACGTAIKSNAYHSTISDFKCYDFTSAEIMIGTYGETRSLQNSVSNGLIFMSHGTMQGWSDENQVIGLAVNEPDNFFDNININRCSTSVKLCASGNEFYNCHFTAQYLEPQEEIADTYAVRLDPVNPDHMFSDEFENCYFDNHKYCFQIEQETEKSINLTNGKYYFSGSILAKNVESGNAYMLGGHSTQINVDNFTIIPSDKRLRFYDSSWVASVNESYLEISNENYNRTLYSLDENAVVPYLASYLASDNESVAIADQDHPLNPNTYYEIGCVTMPESLSLQELSEVTIRCITNKGSVAYSLFWQAGQPEIVQKQDNDSDDNSLGLQVIAGTPEVISQDDIYMMSIPIYLYTSQALDSPLVHMEIKANSPQRGYLYTLNPKESTDYGSFSK